MKRIIALTLISVMMLNTTAYGKTIRPVKVKVNYDEYKINPKYRQSTKVVSENELRIYSNTYQKPKNYTKFSYDEFSIEGKQTDITDKTGSFDELHIPTQYRDNVWQPEEPVQRMGFDEFRLPNEMP